MFSTNSLTHRQAEILEYLQGFQNEGRGSPTYREIAKHFDFKSTKAVADHLSALEKKGYIRRHVGRSRGIELVFSNTQSTGKAITVPILGNLPAGNPELKIEYSSGTLSVDQAMLGKSPKGRLFALKVNGQSMEGRGIYDGDFVVADTEISPRENDVVVALIDGENTLKTLSKQKGHFFLKSENPNYRNLLPIEEMTIQGVIRTVIRRMH